MLVNIALNITYLARNVKKNIGTVSCTVCINIAIGSHFLQTTMTLMHNNIKKQRKAWETDVYNLATLATL